MKNSDQTNIKNLTCKKQLVKLYTLKYTQLPSDLNAKHMQPIMYHMFSPHESQRINFHY